MTVLLAVREPEEVRVIVPVLDARLCVGFAEEVTDTLGV